MEDVLLATFLNGFIVKMRGRREGPQPIPESVLNNNIVLTKLKIALDIQADEMLELVCSRELKLSRVAFGCDAAQQRMWRLAVVCRVDIVTTGKQHAVQSLVERVQRGQVR